ncbi:hypothetical protein D9615_009801 [Tricholomella constricta]|uniref:Chromo domain-containing protein n=1 Tax=Tricholomella constricta TaxID=117010 RepID=A0A8H5GTE0_9AGAR|nr:hypothetical protein D9615_009801 [Tricholomella constricta]
MSDDAASVGSDDQVYERKTQSQFVPQDDDAEVLWEVVEITGEKPRHYKVLWAGVDPKTGKPWAQSWVAKRDCTDDLVVEWKRKQALKKKKAEDKKASKKSRASAISRVSAASRGSTASSSTATKRSTRLGSATTARVNQHGKRTHSSALGGSHNHNLPEAQQLATPVRPAKKRKVDLPKVKAESSLEPESFEVRPVGKRKKVSRETDNEDEGQEEPPWHDEPVTLTNGGVDRGKRRTPEKQEEEESSEEEQDHPPPAKPLPSKSKQKPKTDYPAAQHTPPASTPEPAYFKYKSGKITTPKEKRPPSSPAAESSSSSDEVAVVVPHRSHPTSPRTSRSHCISQGTIERLQEFESDLRAAEEGHQLPASAQRESQDEIVHQMYDEFIDFNAPPASTATKGKSRVSTATSKGEDDSYRQGIVPETETEQSQSQSQSQPLPSPPVQLHVHELQQDAVLEPSSSPQEAHKSRPQPKLAREPTVVLSQSQMLFTPARSSLISKMKPRTPGSSSRFSVIDDDIAAPDFAYHSLELEVHMEVDEEEQEQNEDKGQEAEDQDEDEGKKKEEVTEAQVEAVSRSTSKTGSRTNSGTMRPLPMLSPSNFAPHLPSASSSTSVNGVGIDGAGQAEQDDEAEEVAELMSSIEQFSSPEKGGRSRGSGTAVRRDKGKGKARATDSDANAEGSVTDHDEDGEQEEHGADLVKVVRERGQQLAEQARAERLKRQREITGELGEGKKRTLTDLLGTERKIKNRERREREQVREKARMRRLRQGSEILEVAREKEREIERRRAEKEKERERAMMALRQEEEESTQDLTMEVAEMRPMETVSMDLGQDAQPEAGATSEVPDLEPQLETEVREETSEEVRARSKSKSSSVAGRVGKPRPLENDIVVPSTAPILSSRQNTPDGIDEAPTNAPDIVATLALLNEKSQENVALTKEIEALREALNAATIAPQFRQTEYEKDFMEAREKRDAAEASLAESEKRVADLVRGKDSAEKDREFFREQYAKASGFVSSVRDENNELEKQVEIAKGQAATGVEMVKATFAARAKTLEDDARSWRRLAMFMMEKDVRTNDDIRRRAAEEPELRLHCEVLEEDNLVMKGLIESLQEDMQDRDVQVKDLDAQVTQLKAHVASLNLELSHSKARLETLDRDAEDVAAKNEMVYRCQWRLEGSHAACEGLFLSMEDLEEHLCTGGHLDV